MKALLLALLIASNTAAAQIVVMPSEVTGTAVVTTDPRLTDARTPVSHAHAAADTTGTAVVTADARLSDARTPTTHTHTYASLTGIPTPIQFNQSVAAQGAGFATDTYLTGSSIVVPAGTLRVGSRYHMVFHASKTAAGTATPVITVRYGVNGSTADAARLTFTFTAQTAALDTGTFEVWVTVRAVGASAILQGVAQRRHGASITGFGTLVSETLAVTSASFDSGPAGSIVGVSVNGGSSAAWTVQLVQSELSNLN